MTYTKCETCRGGKTVKTMGGMSKTCGTCHGVGQVKIVHVATVAVKDEVTSSKVSAINESLEKEKVPAELYKGKKQGTRTKSATV